MTTAKYDAFTTRNDLPSRLRATMITLINQQLADILDLYSQVKQAHWNVKGMHFIQLHMLFETLAESLIDYCDVLAERATALGGIALGTAAKDSDRATADVFTEISRTIDKQLWLLEAHLHA